MRPSIAPAGPASRRPRRGEPRAGPARAGDLPTARTSRILTPVSAALHGPGGSACRASRRSPRTTPISRTRTGTSSSSAATSAATGYRSEFIRSNLGTAGTVLQGASNFLGGLWGASNAARSAKDFVDRGARDDALKKAANEIMPLFTRCPRCNKWVDETCWNAQRNLCVSCAPNLAAEMEARALQRRDERRCATRCGRRRSSPATRPPARPSAPTATSRSARRSSAPTAGRRLGTGALHAVRRGAAERGEVLRQLRDEDPRLTTGCAGGPRGTYRGPRGTYRGPRAAGPGVRPV